MAVPPDTVPPGSLAPRRHSTDRSASVSIGGLPHTDPEAAARLVLGVHPHLPAAPQLPHRGEGILAQLTPWMSGVAPTADGLLALPEGPGAAGPAGSPPEEPPQGRWDGLRSFLAVVAGASPAPTALKLQLAGPLTLALGLVDAGLPPRDAQALAGVAVARASAAVVGAARRAAPSADLVVFLDEPALVRWAPGAEPPWSPGRAADALGAAVDGIGVLGCEAGVHCCGPVDWSVVAGAAPSIVSVPLSAVGADNAAGVGRHLASGGRIAWGVLPTDRALPTDAPGFAEGLHARAVERWTALAAAGHWDTDLAVRRCLLSPDCGLSGFSEQDAERALRLVAGAASALCGRTAAGAGR